MLVACGRAARLALLGVACVLVSLRLVIPRGVCVRARRGALPKVGDGAHVLEEGGVDDVVLVKLLEEF